MYLGACMYVCLISYFEFCELNFFFLLNRVFLSVCNAETAHDLIIFLFVFVLY